MTVRLQSNGSHHACVLMSHRMRVTRTHSLSSLALSAPLVLCNSRWRRNPTHRPNAVIPLSNLTIHVRFRHRSEGKKFSANEGFCYSSSTPRLGNLRINLSSAPNNLQSLLLR
ncbi:hypothetical protein ACSQ67_025007 [Phaseolus vulgaris]